MLKRFFCFLMFLVLVFYTNSFVYAAGINDPTIPAPTNVKLDSSGTVEWDADDNFSYKSFQIALLKRADLNENGTIVYEYRTSGGTKTTEGEERSYNAVISAVGYYRVRVRGVNLSGNYSNWTESTVDIPVTSDDISTLALDYGTSVSPMAGGPGVYANTSGNYSNVIGPTGAYSSNINQNTQTNTNTNTPNYFEITSPGANDAAMRSQTNVIGGNSQIANPAGVNTNPITNAAGANTNPITNAAGINTNPITNTAGVNTNPITNAAGINTNPITNAAGANTNPITNVAGNNTNPITNVAGTNTNPITNTVNNTQGSVYGPGLPNNSNSVGSTGIYAVPAQTITGSNTPTAGTTGNNVNQSGNSLEIGWHVDAGGRFFYQGNGVYLTNTWAEIGGSFYRFDETGHAVLDSWYIDPTTKNKYLLDVDGKMLLGWQKKDGKWYYLNPNRGTSYGVMYFNSVLTIDGKIYAFNTDGSMVENAWYNGYYYGKDGARV